MNELLNDGKCMDYWFGEACFLVVVAFYIIIITVVVNIIIIMKQKNRDKLVNSRFNIFQMEEWVK